MKSCKLFDCDFWGAKVCCATCPKKDLTGRARCSTPCQNEPSKCGSYIAYDADINNDGKVDIFDLAMVAGNYGLTSALAYGEWLP